MLSIMQHFPSDLTSVIDRVTHIEHQMRDFATTVNYLVDAHEENLEDRTWIKHNLGDLEDRSCRNTNKIRGISETVQAPNLASYSMQRD